MSVPRSSLSESLTKKRLISFAGKSIEEIKLELTSQLDDKEKLLAKIGTSQITRNALMKQTDVIRKELENLKEYDKELPQEVRARLEDLANDGHYLKSSKSTQDNGITTVSPLLPPPPTNSSPTKHRTKNVNGNRRNPDIEFATEIGQGLLIEVRKLQIALQEKDEIIKQLELSKSDHERNHESIQRQLKQREEIEEKLKEENWNLEVANQELRTHLTESSQLVSKHNSEFTKLTKKLKTQSEQIDIMKAQEEKSNSIIEAMKARHEQETFNLRRHAASAQRDVSSLQKQMEALNTELKICKAKLAVKLAVSSRAADETPHEPDSGAVMDTLSDPESSVTLQPTPPPQTNNRNQAMETETLKQSLAHAHRIISNLRSSLHKEKVEKFEIKKMLSDSQENIELMRKEMSSWNTNHANSFGRSNPNKKKTLNKKKRGGVARRARGLIPNESDTEPQVKLIEEKDTEEEEFDEERKENDEEEYDELEDDDDDESLDDDDDDESLDDNFMDPQFSFGNGFGHTPFSSVPMLPLSSELEHKVQVIDVGINTDPLEFTSCTLEHVSHSAVIQENSNTDSSLVAQSPVQESIRTETLHKTPNDDNHPSGFTTVTTNLPSAPNNSIPQDTRSIIQQQIADALIKERQEIAMRAESMLSPEQIDALIPKDLQVSEVKMISQDQVDALLKDMVPKDQVAAMIDETKLELEKTRVSNDQLRLTIEQELKETMIPKSEMDIFVNDIQLKAKTELEKSIQELTKSEQELKQAIEQELRKDMVSQLQADLLVQEAIQSTKDQVAKSEQELKQAIEQELKETMVPKSEADLLVQDAIQKTKDQVATSEQELKAAIEQELKETMVSKSEADLLVQDAIQKTKDQVTTSEQELKQVIEQKLKETMIPKSEVDELLSKTKQKTRAEVEATLENTSLSQEEKIRSMVESELKDSMISKSEMNDLIEQAKQHTKEQVEKELKDTMLPKTQVNELITQAKQDAQKDMVTKVAAESMVLAAVASITKELQEHKEDASKKLSEDQVNEMIQTATMTEREKAQESLAEAIESLKSELESVRLNDLEKQKQDMEQVKQTELEKLTLELEAVKKSELEEKVKEFEAEKQLEKAKYDDEIEKQKAELQDIKKTEIDALSEKVGTQKKECDYLKQRMLTMLTKESADVLIKRAVTEAVESAEKKHTDAMAGMISREYSTRMIKDEVEKALDVERKQVAEREEREMISKTEADALAKVAAADAIVKERQEMAAREKDLITKEEAELMTQTAVKEALDKYKTDNANLLAKERKLSKEKDTNEPIRITVSDTNTMEESDVLQSPLPTNVITDELHEPAPIERSVSTSRLTPSSASVSPSPSISSPAGSVHKLKLSSSISSLRSNKKDQQVTQKNKSQRQSADSAGLFGSLRVLDTTKYAPHRLQSKSALSLRDLSKQQNSSTSISTMSSTDEQTSTAGRTPMPMSSNESFPGFSTSGSIDINVISAITQTMIGEWMFKHTRRYVGGGFSENKHQRFFWVHPYTRILYWSSVQPGAEGNEGKTKSAYIESVASIPSNDTTGASPKSLLIRTPKRNLKITASSLERHEIWLKSLHYLLGRSTGTSTSLPEDSSLVDSTEHPQHNTLSSKTSNAIISEAVQYDSDESEDMVNIRQCCDGKHDVTTLSRGSHHHHHH